MERKSYLDYAGWLSGQGKAGTTYTLCARLDNLFRSGYEKRFCSYHSKPEPRGF